MTTLSDPDQHVEHQADADIEYYLEDPRLSWRAKGLLTYLRASGGATPLQLAGITTDGWQAISGGLLELTDHGYATRLAVHDEAYDKNVVRYEATPWTAAS